MKYQVKNQDSTEKRIIFVLNKQGDILLEMLY